MTREIRIGTRESALALWQTHWVKERLEALHPEYRFSLVPIKTQGDKILDVALAKIGDKGLFTKELEAAMLEGKIDLAVHSMKDLPTRLPEGLTIGAICEREDNRDCLISSKGYTFATLPQGAKVGTSSLRRRSQLLALRPDLRLADIRGNLQTRLRKLEEEGFDAIVLAIAGVVRLGLEDRVTEILPYEKSLPAVGQGSIGIEIRDDDPFIQGLVQPLEDRAAALAIRAERAMLRSLEGGCQIPIGALGRLEGENLRLEGMVASLDGKRLIRLEKTASAADPEALGEAMAQALVEQGAREILEQVRQETETHG